MVDMEVRPFVMVCGGVLIAFLWQQSLLCTVASILLYLSVCVFGASVGLKWCLTKGQYYRPALSTQRESLISILVQKITEMKALCQLDCEKVTISQNVDQAIQEVIDLVTSDFILSWYKDVGKDEKVVVSLVQADIWHMVAVVSDRLSKIDAVKFTTQDLVNRLHQHFKEIRLATKRSKESSSSCKFVLYPWLENSEKEISFLRVLCEAVLVIILPKSHTQCSIVRRLLREIFTVSVLKPAIDLMCDPDYLNQKLLSYLTYRAKLSEDTRRTYTYSATYEDFVKMIQGCDDIEHLKQIRFNIITEIMQSTTINNWKKAQGMNTDKASVPKSTAKGDLLKARNLKRYINQLTVAKATCEKRIHMLGGFDYKYYEESSSDGLKRSIPGQKVFSYEVIMNTASAREFFMKFLKRDDNHSLLGFWTEVENLKSANKNDRHELGSKVYHKYIASNSSFVKVDRVTIKGMESFMLGNKGPEAFYEGQKQVYKVLEKQHYPSFIVSDVYHEYISQLEQQQADSSATMFQEEKEPLAGNEGVDDVLLFADQSYSIQKRLEKLNEKILNKAQALQTLKSSQKIDAKIKKVQDDMEKELSNLRLEWQQLEAYVERTELWWENQGNWKAHVYNSEVIHDGDKLTPYFVIVVHVAAGETQAMLSNTQGWVVSRTLSDFAALHEKLIQIGAWLKKKDLPSRGLMWFKTIDAAFLDKAKETLEDYLTTVMRDDRMAQSEALFAFLSPPPDFLTQQTTGRRNWNFSLVKLFRGFPSVGSTEHDSDDELLFTTDESGKEEQSRDSVAEHLYDLINEVFELRGLFKWLRKSFIMFVEVTFGRSINRQLRVTVDWIFSEIMLIYYIRTFQEAIWPNGELAEPLPTRKEEEKMRCRIEAKDKFLQNLPDAVKTLVGEDNARQGAIKMFEVMQDNRLNKHLFYGVLEILLQELCPELNLKFPTSRSRLPSSSTSVSSTASSLPSTTMGGQQRL